MSADEESRGVDRSPLAAATAVTAALAILTGAALPIAWGWGAPLVVLVVVTAIAVRGRNAVDGWVAVGGGWAQRFTALPMPTRYAFVGAVTLATAVAVAAMLDAVGGLLVAYPAATCAVVALPVAGLASRASGRGRGPARVLGAILVLGAAVWGAGWEAEGEDARGWAHSGPILGIHPFQTTSIMIDGLGPYDLPINDYVEPDGSRGYDPRELADAIQRALHDIAETHYADGPARAYLAFAEAKVEAVTTDPVREHLDREPVRDIESRLIVWSGTTGQRSRVEFVCPGKPDDPAGLAPERVLNRMCPTKYVSEASAGLGLTGRWTGYAEGRGNERLSLARLFGATRTDDDAGRRIETWEVRTWAWLGLAVALVLVVVRRRGPAHALTQAATATVVTVGVVVGVLALLGGLAPRVGVVESPPDFVSWRDPIAWLPAVLAVVAIAAPPRRAGPLRPGRIVWPVVVALATLVVARHVAADAWVRPLEDGRGLAAGLSTWVDAAADAIGPRAGLSILDLEAAVAGVLAVALVAGVIAWLSLLASAAPMRPGADRDRRWPALAVAVAACLVVSRKTDGGAALVPIAMVTLLVTACGLWLRARPAATWRSALHLGAIGAGLAVLAATISALPSHPFVAACALVGAVALAATATFLPTRRPPKAPQGPKAPT